jgi:carbon starvation protein
VLEVSLIGFLLILASIFAGEWVANSPSLGAGVSISAIGLAWSVIAYGFAASALPGVAAAGPAATT